MVQTTREWGRPSAIATDISKRLTSAIRSQLSRPAAPGETRKLRRFPAYEASEFLGISDHFLRTLHANGTLPVPSMVRGVWRYYTAQEILDARQILERSSFGTARHLPRRTDDEPLQVWQVMNLKGGTGKSTTTIHLAHFFALRGYRVLLVDLDPQGSLTSMCGISPETDFDGPTIYDAIRYDDPVNMADILVPTHFPNLSLAPSRLMLSEFEAESAVYSSPSQPFYERVRNAMRQVDREFDLVFIDSPPQFGFLTIAGITAATSFIIPLTPSMLDISSTAQFLELAGAYIEIIENAGGSLQCDNFKFLITRNEPSDVPSQQLSCFMRDLFPDHVMSATSLKSTVISDAMISKQSIYEVIRSETTRTAYDRARASMDGVGKEVERMVRESWGRT